MRGSKSKPGPRKADDLDRHIGRRLRRRRRALRLSQKSLADRLGLSLQSLQKYETGRSRIAASTLFRIVKLLGVSFEYFIAGLPGEEVSSEAPTEDEERVALRTVKPLTALPTRVSEEVIGLINELAHALGKGQDSADERPCNGG